MAHRAHTPEAGEEPPAPRSTPRRRRKQKLINARQARRALYVDVEARKSKTDPPVLLGVLLDEAPDAPASRWAIRQIILDPAFLPVDSASGGGCEVPLAAVALGELLNLSSKEKRHVVSWSQHDREVIQRLTSGRGFPYRNALRTAKRWRGRQKGAGRADPVEGPNKLANWERVVDYQRPPERFGTGDSIKYIRGLSRVTPGAVERWTCLLEHNRHDLLAMRAVLYHVLGLPQAEEHNQGESTG